MTTTPLTSEEEATLADLEAQFEVPVTHVGFDPSQSADHG